MDMGAQMAAVLSAHICVYCCCFDYEIVRWELSKVRSVWVQTAKLLSEAEEIQKTRLTRWMSVNNEFAEKLWPGKIP
jgi:hypothetical protein